LDYGIKSKGLPQQNPELIRRMGYRWLRAARPHNIWAEGAKLCTDFLEGRQWSDQDKAQMRMLRRSTLTLNMIAPLFRLVMGYQSSNRMDISFLPTSDSRSNEDIATILNNIFKSEANRTDLKYTDTEVFADGLCTGRGFWETRLCFDDNELGEIKYTAKDPFSIYIDPDCQSYDICDDENGAAFVQESVWTTVEAIGDKFGAEAAELVNCQFAPGYNSNTLSYLSESEISPERYFGKYADEKDFTGWGDVYFTDFIDKQAKKIRLLNSQYKIIEIAPCFVDLETGDKCAIPNEWLDKPDVIEKVMAYAEGQGNPLKIVTRPVKKVRQSVTCGDVVLYDDWSIYDDYTITGYFPYFRRGTTRGMVEDLIDAQQEKNKKRSVLTDILNRNANSGWMYHESTLDAEQEDNLKKFGSAPGINVRYKGKDGQEPPRRIEPGGYPQGLDRLEEKAANDLHEISGINQSALGQLDQVQSGRAIEARQRQAVLSIQMYSDNFARSKKSIGKKSLSIFQKYYNEPRVFRLLGEDSSIAQYEINQKQMVGTTSVNRLNDITVGKYMVTVDEVPISATFKQAQFEETMMLIEKLGPIGMALAQTNPGLIIDQSSLPRKNDWKKALEQATSQVSQETAQAAGMPNGGAQTPIQTSTPEQYAS
jgi:hypothetical protein